MMNLYISDKRCRLNKLIDISAYPVQKTLEILLQDKSTKKNIIWASGVYSDYGIGYQDKDAIERMALCGLDSIELQSRTEKSLDEQLIRTRKKAEVFTPVWLCNKMNNYADEQWFGRKNVFNTENEEGHTWAVNTDKILFSKEKPWTAYVDSRRLEITCGEAPYLVSRYDATTGELILPPMRRIGILDRKLRVVNENVDNDDEWLKWVLRAFQSCYGYEYQGDNLLIARINLMMTFCDYYQERMKQETDEKILKQFANVISWNIWQMDGLKDTVPLGKPYDNFCQMSLFDMSEEVSSENDGALLCRIFNWRANESLIYKTLKKGRRSMKNKLFDFCIGNPPYQEEQDSDNLEGSQKNFAPSVYNHFMDESIKVSEKVELIHPARFLFNAGNTPKAWNEKMLNDPHFKVLQYEPDSSKIFPSLSAPLKGGIAITYRDDTKDFGAIQAFTQFPVLNIILHKIILSKGFESLSKIVYSRTAYRLTDVMHKENPDAITKLSKGHAYDMASNIFERLPEIFYDNKPNDTNEYVKILGREDNKRIYKYIRRDYVNNVDNLKYYKVLVPQANGTGVFGEAISQPVIEEPNVGNTETFISIGKFSSRSDAEAVGKFISTKFSRTLLSVLKVTQNGNKPVWKYIPLQDFTSSSDIDWSKSIYEIDQQLYRKYGLSEDEIEFIETNVKEMV